MTPDHNVLVSSAKVHSCVQPRIWGGSAVVPVLWQSMPGWLALAQPRKIPRYKVPTGVSSKSADLKQLQPTEMPLQTRSRAATLCGALQLPFSPLTPLSQSWQGWTLDLVQAAQFSLLQQERPNQLPAPTIVPAQHCPWFGGKPDLSETLARVSRLQADQPFLTVCWVQKSPLSLEPSHQSSLEPVKGKWICSGIWG